MNFLQRVVKEKHDEIASKKKVRPVEMLKDAMLSTDIRDFGAAIAGGGKIIAELKGRTPSIESFHNSESLTEMARVYEKSGASAISIVTDEKNFGTSLADAKRIREQSSLPVIVKDFVLDPYQIMEARAHGADAILLIVRILDWDRLTALLDLARQLGMSALVETHNEAEVNTALQARAAIVGINNRDLDTLVVSLDTTRELARLVPSEVTLVAESGIDSRAHINELTELGCGAFLVGGSLMNSDDPGTKLRELLGKES